MSKEAILLGGAAIAGLYYMFRDRSWSPHSTNGTFGHEIHVVKCPKHCKWILDKMLEGPSRCIGFNCEWYQGKPDMLILADPHKICVLIQLQQMSSVPEELKAILKNKEIVKAGVEAVDKAKRLQIDNQSLQVWGTLDIRYLYSVRPDNLWNIAENKLGIKLRGSPVPYMNPLTNEIIGYSASEVIACAKLLARYYESKQKLGPIKYYLGEPYYSPSYVEQGYDIHYVTTTAHCKWIVSKLKEELSKEVPFAGRCIGFECTWYEDASGRREVELLQIAGHLKLCAIIQLNELDFIPSELRDFLYEKYIFKVGVSAIPGAKLLEKDYGLNVQSVMDLRHVYPRKPNGILALCRRVLLLEEENVSKWKNGKDRCAPPFLSHLQLKFCGLEAIFAIKLFFLHFDKTLLNLLSGNIDISLGKPITKSDKPYYMYTEFVESMSPYSQHKIFNNDIHVVSSPEHCRWVVSKLREDMDQTRHLIGFDFHDDILQLASRNGICALIQLNLINDIPWKLLELLSTPSIIKYANNGVRKAKLLEESYFLQISNVRQPKCIDPSEQNLVTVAKRDLGVDLGETVCIRNTIELTDEEIQYCAGKVIACAKMASRPQINEYCPESISPNTLPYTTHAVFGHAIHIVTTLEHCRVVTKKLQEVIKDCPFIGFDSERLPLFPRGPITLLQLAGGKGSQRLCILIRLCFNFEIPQELRDLLNDPTIAKAGVESLRDVQYLKEDYGLDVRGAIDLRFLYPTTNPQQANGLAALVERELNVYLGKDMKITLSGFNQRILSYEQIQYASGDAIAGANLFDKYWQKCNKSMDQIQSFLDKPFCRGKKGSQPAMVTLPHNAGALNMQSTSHSELEYRTIPTVRTLENSGTGNVQQPQAFWTDKKSKRRSRNKKK